MKLILVILTFFTIFITCTSEQNEYRSAQMDSLEISKEKNKIKVELIDEIGLAQLIQNRKGKILVLNMWATWCIPCREEFPDLIRLRNNYSTDNVDIVGISVDYEDEMESKIKPFLISQKVNFMVFVQNFKNEQDLISFLNENWSGALPATFVYDQNGDQKEFLLGKQSFKNFQKAVERIQNYSLVK
jgi:thiol-disulfide isomerase/thioredoxin